MGIGDDQLDPQRGVLAGHGQAAVAQGAQELGPEVPGLAVPDLVAQDLAAPVDRHAGGDHDGLGDHPPADADLAEGRVEEHVGEPGVVQRPLAPGGHFLIQRGADA